MQQLIDRMRMIATGARALGAQGMAGVIEPVDVFQWADELEALRAGSVLFQQDVQEVFNEMGQAIQHNWVTDADTVDRWCATLRVALPCGDGPTP